MAPLANQEYTVGWICALPLEMAAARAMLDTSHGKPQEQHLQDKNSYHLGSIGQHNIVIACLPSGVYGTTSAATVAAQMLFSFQSIRVGLMVGIGGGIPNKGHDIRLGDVVVSKPDNSFGGVVQYDLGKTGVEGKFIRTGSLNKPPLALLNAISSLQAEHELEESKISQYLSEIFTKYSGAKFKAEYSYQGPENDNLYDAEYKHVGDEDTCEYCDDHKIAPRPGRDNNDPIIHYGVIASGNQVIKDGKIRDRTGKELGAICFEMEAAGLVDNFPCLVIRGICDYSDSHKNKRWQRYAAVTAAAYAKELLGVIMPNLVDTTPTAAKAIKAVEIKIDVMGEKLDASRRQQEDDHKNEIFDWLSPLKPWNKHNSICEGRTPHTSILLHDEFLKWKSDRLGCSMLCAFGHPGAGKTVAISVLIDKLNEDSLNSLKTGVAYVYLDYTQREQTTEYIIGAIIKQLLMNLPRIPEQIENIWNSYRHKKAPIAETIEMLCEACKAFTETYICIDALDECKDVRSLLVQLTKAHSKVTSIRLICTGRPHIRSIIDGCTDILNPYTIFIEAQETDVRAFIEWKIKEHDPYPIFMNDELKGEIIQKLVDVFDGIFLLPVLQINLVLDERKIKPRRDKLRSLKSSLEGTFEQTMKRIKDSNRATVDATNVLTLIYLAERPLTVNELLHALAVEENEEDLDQDNRDDPKTFLDCCLGLATIDVETSTVRFFHLRLREYFAECRQVFNETFEKGHDYIARTCLTYIMFLPLKLDPSLQTGTGSPVSEAQIRLNYPLLDYASCQWGHHLRNSGQKEESVVKLAQRYLSIEPRERYWSQWCLCNLINEGSDVEPSVVSFSKWHIAAYFGIHSVLSDSLIVATELDSKDSYYGKTPLIWSAEYGRQEVVRLLLEQGADVNANDRRKRTALYWAVGNRDEAIVRLLLKHHADVNSRDDGGREVLPRAVWDQQIAIVQLLVEYEADVNARADTGGYRTAEEWSVLHEAAYNGTEKIVELLLKFGASIRAETTKGQTALHMAAKNGHAGAVKQLLLALERKNSSLMRAATDRKNNKGKTPLHQAAKNGQDEVVQLLLRHNVDVSLTDNDGRTALHHAAKCKHWTPKRISWTYENRNKHDAIIRRLLQRKAQITVMDELGYMALHYAAGWGSEAVMRLLLVEHKEDVNVWNGDGDTALHVAAVTGNRDAVPPLLEYMADINVKSKSGSTALDKAELYGRTTVARLLLDQETNINPMRKWEALLRCASNASEAKTKQIIHLMSFNIDGADPTRIGGSYFAWMVLHTAIQSGQTTVIKWLLERMPIVHMPHENLIPLAQAAQRDDMAGFGRLFEELKGDVDALASFGAMYLVSHSLRALYGAAKNGPKAVMQFLQENNTNTEATIEDGERLVAVVEVLLELEKWRDLFREIEQTREAVVGRANQPEGSIVTNLGEDGSSVNVS